jgi:hypothetical protein
MDRVVMLLWALNLSSWLSPTNAEYKLGKRVNRMNKIFQERYSTVACKTGFTVTAGQRVLMRHIHQGFLVYV